MNFLEDLISKAMERNHQFERELADAKIKMMAAGFPDEDFEMMQAVMGWLPEMSEIAAFLGIMCKEFDHLQSAELAKHLVPYILQAAAFLHTRIDKAGLGNEIFSIKPMDHSQRVLGELLHDADRVIQKHNLAKEMIH